MKTVALLGSRNPQGQTAKAAGACLEGMSGEGNRTEEVYLPQMQIERCRQCDENGWGICRSEGRCVIEDDFDELFEKIDASDSIIFATPVYFSDLSESMRAFLDRLRRISRHEKTGEKFAGKPVIGICVAGGGGGGATLCAGILKKTLGTCGFDVVDMVPVRRQNLELKEEILSLTGKWFAGYPTS